MPAVPTIIPTLWADYVGTSTDGSEQRLSAMPAFSNSFGHYGMRLDESYTDLGSTISPKPLKFLKRPFRSLGALVGQINRSGIIPGRICVSTAKKRAELLAPPLRNSPI